MGDTILHFMTTLMVIQLTVLTALYLVGRRHVRGDGGPEPRPETFPQVGLIMPLTGDTPVMRQAVASILDQDYPDYAVICVTESMDDAAVAMLREIASDGSGKLTHVVAGPASMCGQKNHNILAGIRAATTADVFVFCDSTHIADRQFVTNLVAPIARGDAAMTSGFHRIVPGDDRTATIGMQITCMALHLMQPIRLITQPWGGAMAISREAFERFGLADLWAHNIVDDFSMGPHLHRWGMPAWPVPSACLKTPLSGMTMARWDTWLTRQLLYLKFCIPLGWVASILAVFILAAPTVMGAITLLGAFRSAVGPVTTTIALLYAAYFLGLGLFYRTLSPRRVPVFAWLRGYATTFLVLAWSFGRTFTTNTMSWRGIDYKVGWGGVVKEVIRHQPAAK